MQTWFHHTNPCMTSSLLTPLTLPLTLYSSDMVSKICLPLSFTWTFLQLTVLIPSPTPCLKGFGINYLPRKMLCDPAIVNQQPPSLHSCRCSFSNPHPLPFLRGSHLKCASLLVCVFMWMMPVSLTDS